jgi:hypothetical protein
MLSSIVVDEDGIDFDIDWFIDNNISMEPVEKLTPSQLVEFEALKLSKIARCSFSLCSSFSLCFSCHFGAEKR